MHIEWHIGDVIRKLRMKRRMNQLALAKLVGVNRATIVRAEAGDPKVKRETYLKIAEMLKTTMSDLEWEAARLDYSTREETQRTAVANAPGSRFPLPDRRQATEDDLPTGPDRRKT